MPCTVSRPNVHVFASCTDVPVSAPADVALEWKNVLWEAAVQDELTEYQGVPNAHNNRLWDDLFNGEYSKAHSGVNTANSIMKTA